MVAFGGTCQPTRKNRRHLASLRSWLLSCSSTNWTRSSPRRRRDRHPHRSDACGAACRYSAHTALGIDLTATSFISSAGLAVLLAAAEQLEAGGGSLRLLGRVRRWSGYLSCQALRAGCRSPTSSATTTDRPFSVCRRRSALSAATIRSRGPEHPTRPGLRARAPVHGRWRPLLAGLAPRPPPSDRSPGVGVIDRVGDEFGDHDVDIDRRRQIAVGSSIKPRPHLVSKRRQSRCDGGIGAWNEAVAMT